MFCKTRSKIDTGARAGQYGKFGTSIDEDDPYCGYVTYKSKKVNQFKCTLCHNWIPDISVMPVFMPDEIWLKYRDRHKPSCSWIPPIEKLRNGTSLRVGPDWFKKTKALGKD